MVRYALAIDQERCIGCHACAVACRLENNLAEVSWLRVETTSGRMDVPNGCYPDVTLEFQPIACQHCSEAPCLDACATGAIYRRDDGIVLIRAADCNGCEACVAVCPYDAMRVNTKGIAEKCTFCVDRVDAGLPPFCVVCCEGQAMFFGDVADPSSDVATLLANRASIRLKPEARTAPSVFYCQPLPRRNL